MDVKVTISPAQKKALETEIEDITSWFANWLHFRANELIDKLVQTEILRKIEMGETISGTKEDIIMAAPIKTAAEKNVLINTNL